MMESRSTRRWLSWWRRAFPTGRAPLSRLLSRLPRLPSLRRPRRLRRLRRLTRLVATLLLLLLAPTHAIRAAPAPDKSLAMAPNPGAQAPLDLPLKDEEDRIVTLRRLVEDAPLALSMGPFACERLCPLTRIDFFNAASKAGLRAGRDYGFAAIGVGGHDAPQDAARAKAGDLARVALLGDASALRYLTASPETIEAIAQAIGFRFRAGDDDARSGAHSVGVAMLSRSGRVASYLLGVGFEQDRLREALGVAARDEIAAAPSPILLLCLDFDETSGSYSFAILKTLRFLAVVSVLTMAALAARSLRKERASP